MAIEIENKNPEKYAKIIKSEKYSECDLCGFESIKIMKEAQMITAGPWPEKIVVDPKGYFLIKIENGSILAGLVNKKNEMHTILHADNALDLFYEIVKRKLVSRLDHALFLGRELARAEHCLKAGAEFVQE